MGTKFEPNYAIHPGVMLEDDLRISEMTQKELSKKIGVSTTIINEVIKGKRSISAKLAVLLEDVFPYEASYWLRLQSFYEETKARLELKNANSSQSDESEPKQDCLFSLPRPTVSLVHSQKYSYFSGWSSFAEAAFCKAN